MDIAGYTVLELLSEGRSTLIYRAHDAGNNRDVVLKLLKADAVSHTNIVRLQHELEVTRELDLPGVIRSLALIPVEESFALVQEGFKGKSLLDTLSVYQNNTSKFLDLAIHLAEILGSLHEHNLIHKDINPANILIDPRTGEIKLTDFGLASLLPSELSAIQSEQDLEGTLPYIAPEQTGRMNRLLDYRADYYSLGITFYQTLTGHLPFTGTDPLEIVHAHLATMPPALHIIDPNIPLPLSDIVMKLLEKEPESRYQSSHGLVYDLKICAEQNRKQAFKSFPLGKTDIPNRLQISHTLYGRGSELQRLMTVLDQGAEGQGDFIFIAGYAGIGKTSLVGELEKRVHQRRSYFLSGKYEQTQRHIPYSAIIQAFQGLMGRLLSESTSRLDHWKTTLTKSLGINAYIMTRVFPEIELLISANAEAPHPLPVDLGPQENDNRFQLTFRNFLGVFAKPDHPIVLHLDDLQWADFASIQLLRRIILEWKIPCLTFIGSYRDNEIQATHPLSALFDEFKSHNLNNKHLLLQPLLPEHIQALISDTLKTSALRVASLTDLVFEKTQGNPYFTIEFLKSLHKEGLLTFDVNATRWVWSLEKIRQKHVTGNVVDLILGNMQQLPMPTQQAVKLASLMGHTFDLQTLAELANIPLGEMLKQLLPAVEMDLVFAQGNIYRFLHQLSDLREKQPSDRNFFFQFSHDKVQQAAYDLMGRDENAETNLRLGRLLLAKEQGEVTESEQLFPIVEHYNAGISLINQAGERIKLATLNLAAGRRAKASTAYEQAAKYIETALTLLPEDAWESFPRLNIDLNIENAEVSYLLNDIEKMELCAHAAIDHATDLMDKIRAYGVLLPAYNGRFEIEKSLGVARHALRLLGVKLPKKPYLWLVAYHIFKLKWIMRHQTPETILALPEKSDPLNAAILRLVLHAAFVSYFSMPYMIPIIIQISINLILKTGNTPYSAVMFAGYSLVLSGGLGEIDEGHKYAKLALGMPEKYNSREFLSKLYLILGSTVTHWSEPLSNTIPQILNGYQVALETGDLEYAGLYAHMYCYHSYFISLDLQALEGRIGEYNQVIRNLNQPRHLLNNELVHQVVANLQGKTEDPTDLCGQHFDKRDLHENPTELNDQTTTFDYYYFTAYLSYLFGNLPKAREHLRGAKSHLDGALGTAVVPPYIMLETLTLLDNLQQKSIFKRLAAHLRVRLNIHKLRSWAHFAPENQEHRYQLCRAEYYRIRGQVGAAMRAYESAAKHAKTNGYVYDQALASELASKFYLEQQQTTFARLCLRDAYHAYERWGATAKVAALVATYPDLLQLTGVALLDDHRETIHYVNQTGNFVLDMNSAIKAAQTLSKEVKLSTLFHEMVRIIMENAGAERAFVILSQENELIIRAKGESGGSQIEVLPGTALETANDLATSIVQYVARSQKTVLIQNATDDEMFSNDAYIQSKRPKSILCLPIQHQGNLLGILYLENNLTDGAFTTARLQLLPILISQAAISIDHALDREQISSDRDRMKTIVDSVGDALFAVDSHGRIILMNNTALEWLKCDVIPLDQPLGNVLALRDRASGLALLGEENVLALLTAKTPHTFERVEFMEGPVNKAVILSISPIWSGNTEEETRGAVFLLHDRSAEQRLEDAKADFIATASHELRTPLTAILWGLDAFSYDDKLQNPKAARQQIEMIQASASHMQNIVEALLTASKLESASASDLPTEQIEVNKLMEALAAELNKTITTKGLTLETPSASSHYLLQANEQLLKATLGELLNNACRFTEQGKIEVAVYPGDTIQEVTFRGQKLLLSDRMIIEVRDSGCGIDPAQQDNVFSSFFQAGGTFGRQESKGGLGIGLYLTYLRAKQMNAYLWFESVPRQGSSFFLALPTPTAYGVK